MAVAIEAEGLRKVYRPRFGGRTVAALDGVDLGVEPGEVFGLLGPNGAGKTTTVKILLGLTRADRRARPRLFGLPAGDPESRRRVGYLPGGASLSRVPDRAADALDLRPDVRASTGATLERRIPELLERVRLSEWADVRVKKFSKGMTQRLGLAAALVHEPGRPAARRADRRRRSGRPPRDPRPPPGGGRARAARSCSTRTCSPEIERTCGRVAVLRAGGSWPRAASRT